MNRTPSSVVSRLVELYAARGADEYHGEAVTQLEHGLQAALLAEQAAASSALIIAALLHDVGHLLHAHGQDAAERGLDDRHEELGYRYLAKYFIPAVSEPVRLHVPAKRYLCYADSAYRTTLSPASEISLNLQGGAMSASEAVEFERSEHFPAACALRRWDDAAKVPGLPTPPFDHYLPKMETVLCVVA